MKSKLFNGTPSQNKQLAARFVLRVLSGAMKTELVKDEATGSGIDMRVGIQTDQLGLVHVTCGSSPDPNAKIWGWDPNHLAECVNIHHVAFVWPTRDDKIVVAILARDQALALAKKNKGNYSKTELLNHAIKGGSRKLDPSLPIESS